MCDKSHIHGRTFTGDKELAMAVMNSSLSNENKTETFKGINVDTAANRRLVMCQYLYTAYEEEFGSNIPICAPRKSSGKGIEGAGEVRGEATIQIPFNGLGLILDVEVSTLNNEYPSLLSNRDMIINVLENLLQGGYRHICSLK